MRDMKRNSAVLVPKTFRTPHALSMPPRLIQPIYEDGIEYERRVEFNIREWEHRSSSPPERPRATRRENKESRDKERKDNLKERDTRRETFKDRMRGGLPPPSGVMVGYKYPSGSGSSQQLPKSILKQQRPMTEAYPSPPFAQPGGALALRKC